MQSLQKRLQPSRGGFQRQSFMAHEIDVKHSCIRNILTDGSTNKNRRARFQHKSCFWMPNTVCVKHVGVVWYAFVNMRILVGGQATGGQASIWKVLVYIFLYIYVGVGQVKYWFSCSKTTKMLMYDLLSLYSFKSSSNNIYFSPQYNDRSHPNPVATHPQSKLAANLQGGESLCVSDTL